MSNLTSSAMGEIFRDPESSSARTFAQDCKQIFSLSDKDVQDCLAILPAFRLTRLPSERKKLLEAFFENHPTLPRPRIESSFSVLNFFLKQLMNTDLPSDDSSKWGADLETLDIITPKDRSRFESFLSSLREITERTVRKEIERRKTAQRVGPLFQGCLIAVNVRGVLKKRYIFGTPSEDFQPEFADIAVVPAVNITIDDNSEENKSLYFNLEEGDIDYLINCLQAAKKEVAALKDYISKKR
jgi:hypothetical protein